MTNDSGGPDTHAPSAQFRKQMPKHPSPRGLPTARATTLSSLDWTGLVSGRSPWFYDTV